MIGACGRGVRNRGVTTNLEPEGSDGQRSGHPRNSPRCQPDDLLKSHPEIGPWRPRVGIAPRISDAELVTLAVMQALLGFTPERRWLRHVSANLPGMFPLLPAQPGYNKRLRKLAGVMQTVIAHLGKDSGLRSEAASKTPSKTVDSPCCDPLERRETPAPAPNSSNPYAKSLSPSTTRSKANSTSKPTAGAPLPASRSASCNASSPSPQRSGTTATPDNATYDP